MNTALLYASRWLIGGLLSAAVSGFSWPVFAGSETPSVETHLQLQKAAMECEEDIKAVPALLTPNYPGFADKRTKHGAAIDVAFRDALTTAAGAGSPDDCNPILFGYLQSYAEGHLFFLPVQHTVASAKSSATPPPQLPTGDAPFARALSSKTFYLRAPSFFAEHKKALDALLSENRKALRTHPFLIIDIRGNHGGADETFAGLLPLIASGPIHRYGIEALATKENVDAWSLAIPMIPADQAAMQAEVRRQRDLMAAAPEGTYVTVRPDMTLEFASAHINPKRVVVLIDNHVVSSAEQFTLDAQQSRKAVIMGSVTSGTLDYGDIRPFPLPSGERQLWMPTTRSRRLPDHPIDEMGIAPDVKLPADTQVDLAHVPDGAVDYAKAYLEQNGHP